MKGRIHRSAARSIIGQGIEKISRSSADQTLFMTTAQVAIIGAGPLGIELAVALKRAGISCLHFDAKQIGYTISWFPPQTRFFSSNERIAIAGVPLQTADQMKC